jgi:hypothetical protein
MADKLYVSLAEAAAEIRERLNLDAEAAQQKIIDAHELGDLDLRLRRPDDPPDGPFNEKLSRSVWRDLDPWNPNESRQLLFEKSEIDAEQIARRVGWRSRRRAVPTERCHIYVARESLDQLEPPAEGGPTAGRPEEHDYDMIRAHCFRIFRQKGLPKRENEEGWRTLADIEEEIATFCVEQLNEVPPSKSTLQRLRRKVLKDWTERKGS